MDVTPIDPSLTPPVTRLSVVVMAVALSSAGALVWYLCRSSQVYRAQSSLSIDCLWCRWSLDNVPPLPPSNTTLMRRRRSLLPAAYRLRIIRMCVSMNGSRGRAVIQLYIHTLSGKSERQWCGTVATSTCSQITLYHSIIGHRQLNNVTSPCIP